MIDDLLDLVLVDKLDSDKDMLFKCHKCTSSGYALVIVASQRLIPNALKKHESDGSS